MAHGTNGASPSSTSRRGAIVVIESKHDKWNLDEEQQENNKSLDNFCIGNHHVKGKGKGKDGTDKAHCWKQQQLYRKANWPAWSQRLNVRGCYKSQRDCVQMKSFTELCVLMFSIEFEVQRQLPSQPPDIVAQLFPWRFPESATAAKARRHDDEKHGHACAKIIAPRAFGIYVLYCTTLRSQNAEQLRENGRLRSNRKPRGHVRWQVVWQIANMDCELLQLWSCRENNFRVIAD